LIYTLTPRDDQQANCNLLRRLLLLLLLLLL
jgi:hypothetical protein